MHARFRAGHGGKRDGHRPYHQNGTISPRRALHALALVDSPQPPLFILPRLTVCTQILPAKVQQAVEESVERLLSSTRGDFERSVGRPLFKHITDGLLIEIQQVVIKAGDGALPKPLSQLAQKRLMLWTVLDSRQPCPLCILCADARRFARRVVADGDADATHPPLLHLQHLLRWRQRQRQQRRRRAERQHCSKPIAPGWAAASSGGLLGQLFASPARVCGLRGAGGRRLGAAAATAAATTATAAATAAAAAAAAAAVAAAAAPPPAAAEQQPSGSAAAAAVAAPSSSRS